MNYRSIPLDTYKGGIMAFGQIYFVNLSTILFIFINLHTIVIEQIHIFVKHPKPFFLNKSAHLHACWHPVYT